MKKVIASPDVYDESYTKQSMATVVGSIAVVIWFIHYIHPILSSDEWYMATIPFRIFAVIWTRKLSDQQNRDKFWNGFLAFFFPGITLIVIGQLKKLNLRFKLDTGYTQDVQAKELREYANKFIKRARYKEAIFIYQYIVDNLSKDASDHEALSKLKTRFANL